MNHSIYTLAKFVQCQNGTLRRKGCVTAEQPKIQKQAGLAFCGCNVYLYRYITAMKPNLESLLQERQTLVEQLQSIDRLRRGSLSKQFFKSHPPGQAAPQGPYYVLQGFFHGKKFSQRIPPDQAAQVQQDVENYRAFQMLAEEFVTLSDEITRRQDQPRDSKKNSSRRKSRTNSSRKPPPS